MLSSVWTWRGRYFLSGLLDFLVFSPLLGTHICTQLTGMYKLCIHATHTLSSITFANV
jgi:hypothetical protein